MSAKNEAVGKLLMNFMKCVICKSINEVVQLVMFVGYERYNAIRADPSLIFLKLCGPPTSSDEANTGDTIDGEGLR